jgi:hypothetical protein
MQQLALFIAKSFEDDGADPGSTGAQVDIFNENPTKSHQGSILEFEFNPSEGNRLVVYEEAGGVDSELGSPQIRPPSIVSAVSELLGTFSYHVVVGSC